MSLTLQRYRLFEPLEEGFLVLDAAGSVLYLNPAAARMLGKPRSELLGTVLPESLPAIQGAGADTPAVEFHTYYAPGQIWLRGRCEPDDGGLCLYLREASAREAVTQVVENLEEAFILLDHAGTYVYVNREAARIAGCGPEALLGKNAWELYPTVRTSSIYEAVQTVARTGQAVHLETTAPTRGRELAMSFYPRGDYVAILSRDISDRKRAEADLRASRDAFRHLVENSPFGIFAVDADFRLVQVSVGAQKVFEKVQPLLGRDFGEVLHLVWPAPLAREAIGHFRHTLATGEPYRNASTPERPPESGENDAYDWRIERVLLPDGRFGVVCHFYDLSERQRYEARLRLSEERLRYSSQQFETLLNQAPLAVYLIDADFRVVEANPVVLASLGAMPGGLLGRDFDEIAHLLWERAFADRIVGIFRRTLACGEPYVCAEEKGIGVDGQHTGYFEWRLDRITLPDGQYGLVSYARDITAQVQARHALEESEERFRKMADHAPVMIWVTERDASCSYLSQSWYAFTGQTPETGLGSGWLSAIHPDDRERIERAFSEAHAHQESFRLEYRLRRHDRQYGWAIDSAQARFDEQGEFLGYIGSVIDITERKGIEDALRGSEERLRLAAQTSGFGFFDYDVAQSTLYWTPELFRIHGLVESVELTRDVAEGVLHPEDREPFLAKIRAAFDPAGTGEYAEEYRIVRADSGETRWVYSRGRTLFEGEGTERRPVRATGVVADITAAKAAQQEIADLNIRLKRAVAETHHRVKNNLQTLSALMEMLLPDTEGATVPAASLRRVWHHTRTLASLHDLLTQDSKLAADQGTVSLQAALEKLAPLLQAIAGERRIRVFADTIALPLKQSGSFVLLVNELVSNALKHGQGEITVRVTAHEEMVELEVADSGPGFPPNFDPRRAANTGLELVESLGGWDLSGTTRYTNRPEGGARVTVTFPRPPATV